jgi:predicted small lipoprotein YifL
MMKNCLKLSAILLVLFSVSACQNAKKDNTKKDSLEKDKTDSVGVVKLKTDD